MTPLSMHPVDQVSAALTVANLRNQVIAANIANRDTEGYQRLQVAFDRAMAGPEAGAPVNLRVVPESVARKPSLEEDMVALSANGLDYQALARAVSRYLSIAQTIANGGRG